jgi:RimJ/RimL family protein N-acetyltransferase
MFIRDITNSDCNLLFQWANDVTVRNNAVNTSPILWETHEKWFKQRINSADVKFFILEINGTPAGQVRYELNNNFWVIDYSIEINFRGLGYGKFLIKNTLELLKSFPIMALVKADNLASIKIFEALNFRQTEVKIINNQKFIIYIYESN